MGECRRCNGRRRRGRSGIWRDSAAHGTEDRARTGRAVQSGGRACRDSRGGRMNRFLRFSLGLSSALIIAACSEVYGPHGNPFDPDSSEYVGTVSVDIDGDGVGSRADIDDITLASPADGSSVSLLPVALQVSPLAPALRRLSGSKCPQTGRISQPTPSSTGPSSRLMRSASRRLPTQGSRPARPILGGQGRATQRGTGVLVGALSGASLCNMRCPPYRLLHRPTETPRKMPRPSWTGPMPRTPRPITFR